MPNTALESWDSAVCKNYKIHKFWRPVEPTFLENSNVSSELLQHSYEVVFRVEIGSIGHQKCYFSIRSSIATFQLSNALSTSITTFMSKNLQHFEFLLQFCVNWLTCSNSSISTQNRVFLGKVLNKKHEILESVHFLDFCPITKLKSITKANTWLVLKGYLTNLLWPGCKTKTSLTEFSAISFML